MPTCPICHKQRPRDDLLPGHTLRADLATAIALAHPEWSTNDSICTSCLRKEKSDLLENYLREEKGELSLAEREVLEALNNNELISISPLEAEKNMSFSARLSDRMAEICGSWNFIIIFVSVLIAWITLNSLALLSETFDPYPFILLNLLLSCVAALQAPVLMMSQNRKEDKDRKRAEADYKTNLKAELEIRHLHIKLDQLSTGLWHKLIELQKVQLETMEDIIQEMKRRLT